MKIFFLNKVTGFILITFTAMFVVQFMPVLRVPFIAGYVLLLFFLNLKKISFDSIARLFCLLLIYFIFQNLLLQDVVGLLDFLQSFAIVSLYILFHIITKKYLKSVNHCDLKKVAYLLIFLFPLFAVSFTEWSDMRKAGILGNPNISAHTLLTIFPFALLLKPTKKYFLYIVFVMFFVIVILASRSALLAFILGMGGYFLAIRRTIGRFWLIIYAILSLVVSYYAVDIAVYLFDLYLSAFSSSDSRLLYTGHNGRDLLLQRAMERFNNGNHWLGLGFTNAKFEIAPNHFQGTHNGFLDLLMRSGYVGFTLFSVILARFLFDIIKIKNLQKRAAVFVSYIFIISLTTNSSTFFVFNFVFFSLIFIYNLCKNFEK